jgi:hypothetical protein
MVVFPNPPHSPLQFVLFPKMKWQLRLRRVRNVLENQKQQLTILHTVAKNSSNYASSIGINTSPLHKLARKQL